MAGFLEQIRRALPRAEIHHNAVWFAGRENGAAAGQDPYVRAEILASDTVNLERGIVDPGLSRRHRPAGHSPRCSTTWTSCTGLYRSVTMDSYATTHAQQTYQLAGSLLVSNGADALSDAVSTPRRWWAGYQVRLGAAAGPRRRDSSGLWRRDFARGFVLLNEPDAPPRTVPVPGRHAAPRTARRSAACTCGPSPAQCSSAASPSAADADRSASSQGAPGRITRPGPMLARMNPQVEIVVPVYNEELALGRSIRRLHDFLCAVVPVHLADRDRRQREHRRHAGDRRARSARELRGVSHLRLDEKGRGRALRAAWSASGRDVVAYMDVDLSTDLRALMPLVAPLLSGHSDLAIGTRLARGARVVRGPKRELISRAYNVILHTALRARFSDAQCGFKAVRREALAGLLDEVRDNAWFFDTELLVLAQRRGLRIHEVPVDWVDDPDSRVAIVRTAVDDLRGVARLMASGPIARFMGVGVLSTLAYALLFLLLRPALGADGANASALALTAVGNTAANRRFTFGVRGRGGARAPARDGRDRVLPHARADQRRARRAARARLRAVAPARARGADRREHGRHRDALRRAAHLGVPLGLEAAPAARAHVNGGWVGVGFERRGTPHPPPSMPPLTFNGGGACAAERGQRVVAGQVEVLAVGDDRVVGARAPAERACRLLLSTGRSCIAVAEVGEVDDVADHGRRAGDPAAGVVAPAHVAARARVERVEAAVVGADEHHRPGPRRLTAAEA